MTCRRYRELFSAYLDGDLDIAKCRRFEDHLGKCEQCAAEFAGFKEVVALTAALPPVQPSPGFDRSLRVKLNNVEEAEFRRSVKRLTLNVGRSGRRAVVAVGVVCLLLIAAFGVYVSQRGSQSEGERTQILVGREIVPMVHSYPDENIFTNFVMPTVPATRTDGSPFRDVRATVSEDRQEPRTFILPFVMDGHAAQDKPEANYVIKQISLIGASDETGL